MTTALTVHTGEPPTRALERPALGLLKPIATPGEVIQSQEAARTMVAEALKDGRDYGVIPGTGDKPTLLKPGAERLTLAFGLAAQFTILEKEIEHDRLNEYIARNGDERVSFGLYRYVIRCDLVHRETGTVVGSAIASCSSLESKYISRPRDTENTVVKMATKRAHVGATLNALGLSEQFTQDAEDLPKEGEAAAAASSPAPAASDPVCPICGGKMWDNRTTKRNPKAPDWKCRDRSCDGVIWPAKDGEPAAPAESVSGAQQPAQHGSLVWAMDLPLMGKPTSWAHDGLTYGGRPLGAVPVPAMKQARHFFTKLLTDNPADPRADRLQDQVLAITLLLDELERQNPQEKLELETPADLPAESPEPAAAATASSDPATDPDDDLPF